MAKRKKATRKVPERQPSPHTATVLWGVALLLVLGLAVYGWVRWDRWQEGLAVAG